MASTPATRRTPALLARAAAAAALITLLLAGSSAAATIDVEIRTDEFNNNGDCSLREAAQAANVDGVAQMESGCATGGGTDTITLHAGPPYTLTTAIDGTPAIDDGDLELTDPAGVTILGEGRATTVVDGGDFDRILEVVAGNLTLDTATVRNGLVAGGASGGGVLSQGGDVTLIAAGVIENLALGVGGNGGGLALLDEAALTASGDTVINDNISAGGGGIYKEDDGDVTLNAGVSVDGNDASGFGGGIFVSGNDTALIIDGASVSDNFLAENATQFAWGSAINYGGNGGFFLTDAEITGNDGIADRAVAAMDMFSGVASTIEDSTISGNTVTGQDDPDPAIDVLGPAGIRFNVNAGVTISDSTISQNTVTGADPDDTTTGAGIYPLGPLTITGSTIANNSIGGVGPTLAGGALYIESAPITSVGILNSTLTGNSAASLGGAIRMQGGAQLTIGQSTFSGNVAPQGPAIDVSNNPATMLTLRGTIFDNGMNACQVLTGVTTFSANSFNVDAGTSCVEAADDTDFENTDADLDGLDDNGGPTETMQLLGPANLFNGAGICKQLDGTTNLLVDQRGFGRPSEGACEPGAYERFICNGVELMQPGPFPGCPSTQPPGLTPATPPSTTPPAPAPRKKCKKGRKLKKGKCVKKRKRKKG